MVNRRGWVLITSTVLVTATTVVIFLRMISRGYILNQLGKDDWVMFVAWFLTVIYLGIIGLSTRYGTGLPESEQKPEWLEPAWKCVLAIEVVYYMIVYCIKCSILLFYLRLGRTAFGFFHQATKYTIILLTVFLSVCVVVVFTQCQPIEGNWNLFLPERKCINGTAFFYSTSAFNIITNVWILCLPIKILWRVQRPTMERVALLTVFAMGIFACVASCVRLRTIQIFTKSHDPLYDAVPINIWSMMEINIAIICASVPILKALSGPRVKRSTGNGGGQCDIDLQGPPGADNYTGPNSACTRTSRACRPFGSKQSKLANTTNNSTLVGGGESEERIAGPSAEITPNSESEENIPDYGYGVGITSSKEPNSGVVQQFSARDYSTGRPARPGFEIGYHREVEVKIERRLMVEGQPPSNRSRDIDVEEGHRYGARPGRRLGAPPVPGWNGGP